MKYIIRYIIILFLLPHFSDAQIIPFKNYTVRDGLPSNGVMDIAQDLDGYMWLATENGLVKFDGYNFQTYTTKNGLQDNFLTKIKIDSENSIWLGDYNGNISLLRNGMVKTFAKKDEELSNEIVDIIFSSGKVWCTSFDGLFFIEGDTLYPYYSNTLQIEDVLCTFTDKKGSFWLGTLEGLYTFDSILKPVGYPELKGLKVRDIVEDMHGRLWFGTQESGVLCLEGGVVTAYTTNSGLSSNVVSSLEEDSKGQIVVGTFDGGINIIGENFISLIGEDDFTDIEIRELFADTKGRLWARTLQSGIFRYSNNDLTHINNENGLIDNSVNCIFEDFNSNIWIGTSNGGISIYRNSVFSLYVAESELGSLSIRSVKATVSGDIYAGSDYALYKLNDYGIVETYTPESGLVDDPYIISLEEGENDLLIAGTMGGLTMLKDEIFTYYSDTVFQNYWYDVWSNSIVVKDNIVYSATEKGLVIFLDGDYSLLTEEDGLISNDLYSLAIDVKGNIWCGSSEGLSVYDGVNFYNYTVQDGLPNNFCNDICFDKQNVAWIATDNGVASAVLESDFNFSTKNYSTKDGLSSNSIFSIVSDFNGNVWFGHNKGVDKLNHKTRVLSNYGYQEGFLPIENNLGAIDVDRKGNVWFGTVNGVVKYSPEYDQLDTLAPRVYISSMDFYNDTTPLENYYSEKDTTLNLPIDLVLPHNKQNLLFNYVGLHYKNVDKNRYKYRLLGYEDNWSEVTPEIQTPPYRKLPHGKYTFQVMAGNSDNVWTNAPAEFSFRILPSWWKTIWAIVLQVVFVVGVVLLVMFLRVRKLKKDKKVLTEKVKERTYEIQLQKEQIEEQRDEITRQKQSITDSIMYAEHIQSAILPKDDTIRPILNEYFILYKPRDIVSGDFYWIDRIGNKRIAIVADCTGHGVPGAFLSMLGVSILNQLAALSVEIPAHEILNQLRAKIISTLSHTRKNEMTRDGMDIALCVFDLDNNQVEFSGAYNSLILVRNKEVEVYKGNKMPVGSMPSELKSFTSICVKVEKGDCLYMFSDGYADQFGGEEGKKFKIAPFRNLLIEISPKSLAEQKLILEETINKWMINEEQVDDILVMGIRI